MDFIPACSKEVECGGALNQFHKFDILECISNECLRHAKIRGK